MTESCGLYIHIPFCRSRCGYCGFYAISQQATNRFVASLLSDMDKACPILQDIPCDTVYLGGGTPSVLTKEQLEAVMSGLRNRFRITPDAEITMEMNPGDMTASYLRQAKELGINRLSVGVQSHDNRLLRAIGRQHTAKEAALAVKRAYKTGFQNISIDLMYELPEQSPKDFERSLLWAVHLPITHVSVYSLLVEERTLFARLAAKGLLSRPTEEESWAMYQAMCRILPHYGFLRYEISSFAHKGCASRHNQKYWTLSPYIGFGPSASSRWGRTRRDNLPGLRLYEKECLSGNGAPANVIPLSETEEMEEYAFLHLRMRSGINREKFRSRYGIELDLKYGKIIQSLKSKQLIFDSGDRICLTYRGAALGNYVFSQFLQEK